MPTFICWDKYTDSRGDLFFNNFYLFDEIKRIYFIEHSDKSVERGWRAHKTEQRWFMPMMGSFEIKVVKIDNFSNPNPIQEFKVFNLNQDCPGILHIPKGYATLLKSLELSSRIMVMADSRFENAVKDDYLFPLDYFKNQA